MEKEKETGIVKFMLLGAIIIIGLQVVFGIIIYLSLGGWEKTGVFGDTFGALNPLFSGLAFAGVIFAIILQKKELTLQRKELKKTKKELERSATAQEHSEKLLRQQTELLAKSARISAFASLLNGYIEQLQNIHVSYMGDESNPRERLNKEIAGMINALEAEAGIKRSF